MCERGHKNGHNFVSNSNEDLMVFTIYKVSYRSFWWVGEGGTSKYVSSSHTAILACHSCVLLLKVQNYQQWTLLKY